MSFYLVFISFVTKHSNRPNESALKQKRVNETIVPWHIFLHAEFYSVYMFFFGLKVETHTFCLAKNVEIASKYLKNKKTIVEFFFFSLRPQWKITQLFDVFLSSSSSLSLYLFRTLQNYCYCSKAMFIRFFSDETFFLSFLPFRWSKRKTLGTIFFFMKRSESARKIYIFNCIKRLKSWQISLFVFDCATPCKRERDHEKW